MTDRTQAFLESAYPAARRRPERRGRAHVGPSVLGTLLASFLLTGCTLLGGPSGSQAPTPPPGFPVGSWTTTISRADLQAGGLEGELVDQNEGEIVLTFEPDGSWQSVQTSGVGATLAEPVLRGHYVVTDDEVRLNLEFPAHYAAEGVYDVVHWQLEGATLHLSLAGQGDAVAAVVYGAHPWQPIQPSAVVGAWQMTVSKDDLKGIGISDPGALNENAGRFTRSFLADGTWTTAQESLDGSPVRNPVWRGTYRVEGDEMRVQIDFPTEYQGDLERYRWTVDGGELQLTMLEPTDDPIARLLTEAHPWTRTTP